MSDDDIFKARQRMVRAIQLEKEWTDEQLVYLLLKFDDEVETSVNWSRTTHTAVLIEWLRGQEVV